MRPGPGGDFILCKLTGKGSAVVRGELIQGIGQVTGGRVHLREVMGVIQGRDQVTGELHHPIFGGGRCRTPSPPLFLPPRCRDWMAAREDF